MRFSILVPTVESRHSAFESCLPSFLHCHGREHEVIVADDGSDDDARLRAAARCHEEGLLFFHSPRNRGFASTVNAALRQARGDIVVLVNSDVRFFEPVLDALGRAFSVSPRIGAVGGLLRFPSGGVQHAGVVRRGRYFVHRGRDGQAEKADIDRPGYALACTGALLGLRREMIDAIGPFDERLRLGYEDVEYCLRAWQRGWRVYYSPAFRAIHEQGGTRGSSLLQKLVTSPRWTLRELNANRVFRRTLRVTDLVTIEDRVQRAEQELRQTVSARD